MNEHAPVLHEEVVAALAIKPKGYYVDGTYGRGGHASSILAALDEDGRLIVVDRDPQAIADARARLGADTRARPRCWMGCSTRGVRRA